MYKNKCVRRMVKEEVKSSLYNGTKIWEFRIKASKIWKGKKQAWENERLLNKKYRKEQACQD